MNYLAIDLGAESGRMILGSLRSGKIALEEIHRFPNGPVERNGSLFWKFDGLTSGILTGLKLVAAKNTPIAGISTDAWGVDYVFNGDPNEVFNYRDRRTKMGSEKMLALVPWTKIFEETGIQYMPINTLFQLASEKRHLHGDGYILSVADYFNHFLGGEPVSEESIASTFQIYNPRTRKWSEPLLYHLGLSPRKLPKVVPSGTIIGNPNQRLAPGLVAGAKIIATCSHDTSTAVAAVPVEPGRSWAYISSGTWSLMGVERPPKNGALDPIITDQSRDLNFTNEIGHGSTIRLLKNISGLWLLQESRRVWARAKTNEILEYGALTELAANEPGFRSIINPADPKFLAPTDMPATIAQFCRATGQIVPGTPAAFTRCIFESLALLYRKTLLELEQLTGQKIEVLHIVGGGSRNALLNQFTADACGIPVLAGPVEATALGNIMIQAITLGEVADLPAARAMIRKNFELNQFQPKETGPWLEAFERFKKF